MTRMRITITAEYEAHPDNYDSTDPQAMAAEDKAYFAEYPSEALYVPEPGALKVTVEPV